MRSPVGAALLTKIAQIVSDPIAGQTAKFLTLAEGWDMREVAFDLPPEVTGISSEDIPNLRGNFSRRVNSVPWSSPGTYIWDIYDDILNGPVIRAKIPDTDSDEDRIQAARELIRNGDEITPQYKAYKSYEDEYLALKYKLSHAEFTLDNSTDPELKAQASADRDFYRDKLNLVTQEWIAKGYKVEIDNAINTISEATQNSLSHQWQLWKEDFIAASKKTDSIGEFLSTGYRPQNFYQSKNNWINFKLSGSEVSSLAASATPEVLHAQDALGDPLLLEGEIDNLTMEVARIDVERNWFHHELLANRFWKWRIPSQSPLSDGARPIPHGTLPGYVTGLVLVRNISITMKRLLNTTSNTSPIRVLGNFALTHAALNSVAQPKSVLPIRAELLLERLSQLPESIRHIANSMDGIALGGLLNNSGCVEKTPNNKTVELPYCEQEGSHSTGDAVYLVAYIVQLTPKSPNPDPDPSLSWS